jgi:hypothetical protein
MGVRVILSCGGCDATAEGTQPIRRRFHGTHGDWGLGRYLTDPITDAAPEGWVMFDPYTQATYCPDCWAQIDPDNVPDSSQETEAIPHGC